MRLRTVAIIVLLVAVVTTIIVVRSRRGKAPEPGGGDVVRVERGRVELTVSGDGILQPLTTVAVKSYAGGQVDVLAVDVGDIVKAGDLIAKIDPTDSLTTYNQAVADLTAAEARLRQAQEESQVQPTLTQAAIREADASYNSALKDLERLEKATQPQARADARAGLDKAQANAEIAEKELVRTQGLKEQGFVPQSDVDTAVNRRDLARAELASAQQRWDTLAQELTPELESAQARVQQAKAGLDRARANSVQDRLRIADVASAQAQVARAQAAVDNARTMLDYTTIRAPRAGVILVKSVEQGTIITSGRSSVSQGTDIVSLGDLTKMIAEVSLDEVDVSSIRVGQPVTITVDALPDEVFHGVVKRIDPSATTQQNITTVLVRVEVTKPDPRMKPGMTVGCDFTVERVENALYLPSRAIREVGGRHVVTVLKGNEQVKASIEVGVVGDENTQIREGLQEGDQVVVPSVQTSAGEAQVRQRGQAMGQRAGGMGGFLRAPGS